MLFFEAVHDIRDAADRALLTFQPLFAILIAPMEI